MSNSQDEDASSSTTPTNRNLPITQTSGYFTRRPLSPTPNPRSNSTASNTRFARSLSNTRSASASSSRGGYPRTPEDIDPRDTLSEEDEDDVHTDAHGRHSVQIDDNDGHDDNDSPNDSPSSPDDAALEELATSREFTEDDPLTLKDRQSLLNAEHPFGLPIWKPALYKKSRSITRNAETAVHSIPHASKERHLHPGNILWTILFGWWLGAIFCAFSIPIWVIRGGSSRYASIVFGLGWYMFWPFGKYVEGDLDSIGQLSDQGQSDSPEETENTPTPTNEEANPLSSDCSDSNATIRKPAAGGVPLYQSATVTLANPQGTSHDWNGEAPPTERTYLAAEPRTYGVARDQSFHSVKSTVPPPTDYIGFVLFWIILVFIVAPLMLIVCLICWGLVFPIPMAKLNWELLKHLFVHPLSIRFRSAPPPVIVASSSLNADGHSSPPFTIKRARLSAGHPAPSGRPRSTVLLCIYKAFGSQYYKYTIGGVNILFVNTMPIVFFAILDGLVLLPLVERLEEHGHHIPHPLRIITSRALIFITSLISVIPLSYFIGMAVASISAQSSIGMGAVINATFGSIIEIILYSFALTESKGALVEGSLIGSILAGVLLMPGVSMVSAAFRKKESKFNAKSAGVTSTMLVMAMIGVLAPTLFYQIYGTFQLVCDGCPTGFPNDVFQPNSTANSPWVCKHCYYEHPNILEDPFFQNTVEKFMYMCAVVLVFSYLVGLWFSLRTHAAQIWQNPQQLMRPLEPVHDGPRRTSIYQRLISNGLTGTLPTHSNHPNAGEGGRSHGLARKPSTIAGSVPPGKSRSRTPAAVAMTPAASHSRSQAISPAPTRRNTSQVPPPPGAHAHTTGLDTPFLESVDHAVGTSGIPPMDLPPNLTTYDFTRAVAAATATVLHQTHQASPARPGRLSAVGHEEGGHGGHGGHEGPSWSRLTSASVLLGCTALYAAIAEILVDVVDVVLEGSGIDEKFLGISLFALVPNTTEFMNAMSFAINGNIALSMEIGSAYALQVCLLQIPAMVAFSALYYPDRVRTMANSFILIFPRWDVVAIILSIFLLTYTYIEAKSNYHRGSILILSYLVLAAGFYFAPHQSGDEVNEDIVRLGVSMIDTGRRTFSQSLSTILLSFFKR
ncbi:hypothetical protein SISSUDRAFT_1018596 [Sistotremastrum suecicum HHB10207 ss-3]|uniref:Calcium permease n=1 Tax=Sistotremastrum suecicum HHB10207 ss-3 TaxID=1314776 RepID=A0A166FG69_9AGAM|nr:hypothetical protein SISSUDRAFT_1018596 [Sistotremastrum suecicum HHB10207 ss-3]